MAQLKAVKEPTPTKIDKFLGLNLSNTGDTQIQFGESGNMDNFYITNDLKLRKMSGYKTFWDFGEYIRGIYSTNLGGTEYLFVAAGGNLYSFPKAKLEDDWELIGDDSQVVGKSMSTEYRLISTMGEQDWSVDTYAKYSTQDEETNTTTYQIKTVFWSGIAGLGDSGVQVNDGIYTFEGDSHTIPNRRFPFGQTTIFEETFQAQHDEDGISPSVSAASSFQATIYSESKNLSTGPVYIKFPKIGTPPFYGVEPTLLGSIGDGDVSFFTFDKKVYILSGKYHSVGLEYNSQTAEYEPVLNEVEGYTPLVFINTPPAGGGIVYDEINMLSNKKHQTFNGDGSSKTFHLAQNYSVSGVNLTSIDKVIVNGNVVASSGYSYDLAAGTVTINTAPSVGMDNVDIYWTLNDGNRSTIEGMKFGTVFGGDVDTRVFLYGNNDMPNRAYFSGINSDTGQPSVEYFPASSFVDVGPANFMLTDLTRQYDRLLATTNRPEAYYLTISTETLPITLSDNSTTSRLVPSVSTFPLNEIHGNVAPGQGQLIDNYPVTLDRNALILWKATNVRDEKNMEDISQKIKLDLNELDLSAFKTMDFQKENQLWFGSNNRIYIYNYYNKTYSRLRLPADFVELAALGNSAYMAMLDGKLVKWGSEFQTYDGETIRAHWEMNFSDFGAAYLRKTMNRLWVLMQPQSDSSAEIGFITNKATSTTKKTIRYKIQFFEEVDFSDFSFEISNNPQPFRLKMKAKKFTNLKVTIDNNEDTDCTILQLVLRVESFGESK